MKSAVVVIAVTVAALASCKKSPGSGAAAGSGTATDTASGSAAAAAAGSATASGSATQTVTAPVEDVTCEVAAKEYTKKMAAAPGNILSDAKPNDGLIMYTSVSMEDYCVGEDGCCVPWTPAERACVKAATPETVSACFTGAAAQQVMAGLTEVVTSALQNKKDNEARDQAEGSGAAN